MDEDRFNIALRKFLKVVGITSQREIERVVRVATTLGIDKIRLTGGEPLVIDGPFTETKEIVGGFALIQARSKGEAIEFTKRFLKVAGDGETEIRQLYEQTAK